ncbi:zinc-ribbon domain containing protein [Microbulbifer taiwanensis]|uniref:Zinc-ribbon domain containing protein n=1 Tax=Microbulbifer taiwanensis TaxID=986746 RepID=A0ABW1YQG3_9GAMM|nr:zinc-ribbon domain containing protein [Microbulbifer taiwanensis]
MFKRIKLQLFGRRAIKGDVALANKEILNAKYKGSWSIPAAYRGEEIVCSKCGTIFTFSAAQKKEYYEVKGGKIYAKIHMCPQCYGKQQA